MKKVIIFLFLIVITATIKNEDNIIIPHESLRFRIVANSNSVSDQMLKMNVRTDLLPVLKDISHDAVNIDEARKSIDDNMPKINEIIKRHTDIYNVNFGQNFFPQKSFQNVVYNEGYYESLVITLGDGIGDNWWCVLFPPLCLLEAQKNNLDNVTYDAYIKKIINEYL